MIRRSGRCSRSHPAPRGLGLHDNTAWLARTSVSGRRRRRPPVPPRTPSQSTPRPREQARPCTHRRAPGRGRSPRRPCRARDRPLGTSGSADARRAFRSRPGTCLKSPTIPHIWLCSSSCPRRHASSRACGSRGYSPSALCVSTTLHIVSQPGPRVDAEMALRGGDRPQRLAQLGAPQRRRACAGRPGCRPGRPARRGTRRGARGGSARRSRTPRAARRRLGVELAGLLRRREPVERPRDVIPAATRAGARGSRSAARRRLQVDAPSLSVRDRRGGRSGDLPVGRGARQAADEVGMLARVAHDRRERRRRCRGRRRRGGSRRTPRRARGASGRGVPGTPRTPRASARRHAPARVAREHVGVVLAEAAARKPVVDVGRHALEERVGLGLALSA